VKVPDRLRPILGVSKLVVPLHTDSLALANRDKHKHVHILKQRLATTELELRQKDRMKGKLSAMDPLVSEALQWRESFAQEDQEGDGGPDAPNHVSTALEARYDELERAEGEARANLLVTIATGRGTPIGPLADQWLEVKPLKPRQLLDYRRGVAKLEKWMVAKGLTPTIEATTRRVAGDYRDSFIKAGVHPRTANKDISVLAGLWKHAERLGVVTENPWRGQTISETHSNTTSSAHKRPLSDTEVATLLTANHCPPMLRDALTLLALSGMRTEELARLRVSDLKDLDRPLPFIALRGTKTQAARRDVPIHPQALQVILGRVEGKAAGDYLLHELPTPPEGSARERGQPLTKAFGRLRKRLGIDEREPGARQANVDLHGLRRWFISKARDALNGGAQGWNLYTVAEIVGHAKGDLGLSMTSRYAGAESLEAKAKAVESVRLPT